jgi:hypothetical protein
MVHTKGGSVAARARSYLAKASGCLRKWVPAVAAGAVMCGVCACGDGEERSLTSNPKAIGATVDVKEGKTTVGFVRGTTKVSDKVGSFVISKHPVTTKQYESCWNAGSCGKPKTEECPNQALAKASFKGDSDNVAICVGEENARAFCKWVGGRLPTLTEWLTAARGTSIEEYPWGASHATCAQHPRSVAGVSPDGVRSLEQIGCEPESVQTKLHGQGASKASKMEDILLAPAELVQGAAGSPYTACPEGRSCLVYGMNPGGMDGVKAYWMGSSAAKAYGFRCVVVE